MIQYPQYYEGLYGARLAYNYLYIAINKQNNSNTNTNESTSKLWTYEFFLQWL